MITLLSLLFILITLITVTIIFISIGGAVIVVFGVDIIIAAFVLWLIFRKKKKG